MDDERAVMLAERDYTSHTQEPLDDEQRPFARMSVAIALVMEDE